MGSHDKEALKQCCLKKILQSKSKFPEAAGMMGYIENVGNLSRDVIIMCRNIQARVRNDSGLNRKRFRQEPGMIRVRIWNLFRARIEDNSGKRP